MLGERHRAVEPMIRRFADQRLRPLAGELDASERSPAELHRAMAGLGLLGLTVPAELGGAGLGPLGYVFVIEELARGDASVADRCGLVELVATLLVEHGTPARRARSLEPRWPPSSSRPVRSPRPRPARTWPASAR